jgi:oxaloacetate decarboxylase gamma subunit
MVSVVYPVYHTGFSTGGSIAVMSAAIVEQGVELMLFGMGTVVLFLALLVLATTLMSRLVTRYFPEPEPAPVPARPASAPVVADTELVAVISAAIHRHRKGRGRDHTERGQ